MGRASYLSLILPGGWLLMLVAALADLADTDPLATAWLACGTLLCLAAILVIIGRRSRRVWAWSIGAIPASFLGPFAFALLFVPAIRQDLRAARVPRPSFQHSGPAVQASNLDEAPLTGVTRKPDRIVPRGREPDHEPPPSLHRLAGLLAACVGAGAAIFIGLLTLLVFAGVHKFTNHQGHVLILVSVVPAAAGVLIVGLEWTFQGTEWRQRAMVALPAALVAQAVLWGTAAWVWSWKWS